MIARRIEKVSDSIGALGVPVSATVRRTLPQHHRDTIVRVAPLLNARRTAPYR